MKIGIKDTFNFMILYVKNDYELDPETWCVRDLLGCVNMMPQIFDSGSPTVDPAYWYDWRELVKEELEKDKSIIDEINGLTLEQGLVAMYHFFDHRYWLKDNDMLLKDAYKDLVKEYNVNKHDLEYSQLWRDWLAAVAEGKKFDKVFTANPEVLKHLYHMF